MSDRTCSIEGCERPIKGRGWCSLHYGRFRRYGDPLEEPKGPQPLQIDYAERLLANRVVSAEGCWRWTGPMIKGYGTTPVRQRAWLVHRLAHELWIGPIPDGYHVDHVRARGCVHTDCFNPAHLEAVTPSENQARRAAYHKPVTHCIRGHEFNEANTLITTGGRRWCRACGRLRQRRRRERLRMTA